MGVTSVAIQFTIVDLLSKGIESLKTRLRSLSSTSKDVQRSFDNMTRSFKYAAMAGIATREMHKGLKPAISLAGDLQAEMLKVKTELMGGGKGAQVLSQELRAVKAAAFSIQAWTPFDMTQIVALEKELIKAGATVEQITSKTGAAVASAALATYEGVDPVETGKALIRIATPFNLTADKFMELADVISKASSASTADLMDIVMSSKYAAGVMATLGRSTKEMAAMSALMSQVGLQGETGGRAMREFFQAAVKIKAFKDAKGNLIETTAIIKKLREEFKGMGEAAKIEKLNKRFGELGSQTAMAFLKEGETSYEALIAAMDKSIGVQQKIDVLMQSFKKQMESLRGTFKSTIADLFQPALAPLTKIIAKANEFVAAIGTASQKGEGLSKAVSGVSLGAVAAGSAATLGLGAAGIFYGRKVLKGAGGVKGLLKGFGGTAAGIAEGKAVQAATGVQPVFVTNWPMNLMNLPLPIPKVPGGAGGAAGFFGNIKTLLTTRGAAGLLGAGKGLTALKTGATIAAAGAGTTAALSAAALAVGYAVGTGVNKALGAIVGVNKKSDKWYEGGIGGWLGEKLYDVLHPKEVELLKKAEIKNNIPMNITIVGDKAIVENQGMNTKTDITLERTKL